MQIYSKNTEIFLAGIKTWAKDILNNEMNVNFKRSRVHANGYTYPLKFVVFEGQDQLGYFQADQYIVGLNKKLMYSGKDKVIKDILRHELVHFYQYIHFGPSLKPHDQHFRELCQSFGYQDDVFKAALNLDLANESLEGDLQAEKIINRVKKLYSLAASDNKNESELATLKANELLLKYNLQRFKEIDPAEHQEVCVKKVIEAKKTSSKMRALYEILQTFYVQPVFNHGRGYVYLEVIGLRTNVELAHYICDYLSLEFERLWDQAKAQNPNLKGLKSKNSFFIGLAKGYLQKVNQQKVKSTNSKELIILKQDLDKQVKAVYGNLSYSSSRSQTCHEAKSLGTKYGKDLTVKKGLQHSKKSSRLLSFIRN